MKRIYYPIFCGSACFVCSVSWDGGDSEFSKYFNAIGRGKKTAGAKKSEEKKIREQSAVVHSLESLCCGTLKKSNAQKYHGFTQFRDPELYVLKSHAHRFFLVYDKTQMGGRLVDIAVILCCLRKQRDSYSKGELGSLDKVRLKYWENREQFSDELSDE